MRVFGKMLCLSLVIVRFVFCSVAVIVYVWAVLQQSLNASKEKSQACKKEERLLKELEKLTKITSAVGYKSKAPLHVQESYALKVGCWCLITHNRYCRHLHTCRSPDLHKSSTLHIIFCAPLFLITMFGIGFFHLLVHCAHSHF